jgi:hypothetical protein
MPSSGFEKPRFCSQCGNPIVVADASFCKDCGAALHSTTWIRRNMSWRPWVALLLSVIPGLGQWYKHYPWRALGWFVGVILAYNVAFPLGLIIHAICAGNAALSGAIREEAFVRHNGSPGVRRFSGARPRA